MLQLTADAVLHADGISGFLMVFAFSSHFVLKFGGVLQKTATTFFSFWERGGGDGGGFLILAGEQDLKMSDRRHSREIFQSEKTKDPGGWKCYVRGYSL